MWIGESVHQNESVRIKDCFVENVNWEAKYTSFYWSFWTRKAYWYFSLLLLEKASFILRKQNIFYVFDLKDASGCQVTSVCYTSFHLWVCLLSQGPYGVVYFETFFCYRAWQRQAKIIHCFTFIQMYWFTELLRVTYSSKRYGCMNIFCALISSLHFNFICQ